MLLCLAIQLKCLQINRKRGGCETRPGPLFAYWQYIKISGEAPAPCIKFVHLPIFCLNHRHWYYIWMSLLPPKRSVWCTAKITARPFFSLAVPSPFYWGTFCKSPVSRHDFDAFTVIFLPFPKCRSAVGLHFSTGFLFASSPNSFLFGERAALSLPLIDWIFVPVFRINTLCPRFRFQARIRHTSLSVWWLNPKLNIHFGSELIETEENSDTTIWNRRSFGLTIEFSELRIL